jgi:hypothetical protein
VSTRPAAFTAVTSVVWSFELTAFWTMFCDGYIGAPPTVFTPCAKLWPERPMAATARAAVNRAGKTAAINNAHDRLLEGCRAGGAGDVVARPEGWSGAYTPRIGADAESNVVKPRFPYTST